MKTIIVTGHGNFATGIVSAMELIAGKQENVFPIDFTINHSSESLSKEIEGKINLVNDEIVILSDLAGGTPFNVSVLLKTKYENKDIEVFSGTNLAMLLETTLMKDIVSMEELLTVAENSAKISIKRYEIKESSKIEDLDDGI